MKINEKIANSLEYSQVSDIKSIKDDIKQRILITASKMLQDDKQALIYTMLKTGRLTIDEASVMFSACLRELISR